VPLPGLIGTDPAEVGGCRANARRGNDPQSPVAKTFGFRAPLHPSSKKPKVLAPAGRRLHSVFQKDRSLPLRGLSACPLRFPARADSPHASSRSLFLKSTDEPGIQETRLPGSRALSDSRKGDGCTFVKRVTRVRKPPQTCELVSPVRDPSSTCMPLVGITSQLTTSNDCGEDGRASRNGLSGLRQAKPAPARGESAQLVSDGFNG